MAEKPKTIGILTSGGDSPGMNACIRAAVRAALASDVKVLGVVNGYEGLISGEFRPLGARDVGGIPINCSVKGGEKTEPPINCGVKGWGEN